MVCIAQCTVHKAYNRVFSPGSGTRLFRSRVGKPDVCGVHRSDGVLVN